MLGMGAKEKIVVLCFVTVTSAAIGEPITLVEIYADNASCCLSLSIMFSYHVCCTHEFRTPSLLVSNLLLLSNLLSVVRLSAHVP